mgnify:CR=1 FL=1
MKRKPSYITVGDLIEMLGEMDPEAVVVMQKDGEGNGYSPLSGVDDSNVVYVAESTWSGEVMLAELTEEAEEAGFSADDVYDGDDGEPCVVFYPVN